MDRQAIIFYADENVDGGAVQAARRRGVEIVTVRDAGLLGAGDPAQFAYAIENQYVLVTGNERDFCPLYNEWLAQDFEHPGVFFITNRHLKDTALITDVLWLWYEAGTREDFRNLIEWI
jgi:hypothetical protein